MISHLRCCRPAKHRSSHPPAMGRSPATALRRPTGSMLSRDRRPDCGLQILFGPLSACAGRALPAPLHFPTYARAADTHRHRRPARAYGSARSLEGTTGSPNPASGLMRSSSHGRIRRQGRISRTCLRGCRLPSQSVSTGTRADPAGAGRPGERAGDAAESRSREPRARRRRKPDRPGRAEGERQDRPDGMADGPGRRPHGRGVAVVGRYGVERGSGEKPELAWRCGTG